MDMGVGQPDAGVFDGQHRSMSLPQGGRPDRIGSLFATVLARLPQRRIPAAPNSYAWASGRLGRPWTVGGSVFISWMAFPQLSFLFSGLVSGPRSATRCYGPLAATILASSPN